MQNGFAAECYAESCSRSLNQLKELDSQRTKHPLRPSNLQLSGTRQLKLTLAKVQAATMPFQPPPWISSASAKP